MKLLIAIFLLSLIANCKSGLITGVIDAVKGTVGAIKEDFDTIFHGKEETKSRDQDQEPSQDTKQNGGATGLIKNVHDGLRYHIIDKVDEFIFGNKTKPAETGKGLIKHVHDGVKDKIEKVDDFIFGGTKKPAVPSTEPSNNKLPPNCKQTLDPQKQIMVNLCNEPKQNEENVDGENLIDVRIGEGIY